MAISTRLSGLSAGFYRVIRSTLPPLWWSLLAKAQTLTPISTHRPTQGLNTNLVEPGSWQVESGFEPYGGRSFVPEFVLQPRLGLGKRAEAFWTARVARAGSVWRFRTLAFSPKVQLLKRQTWQIALVGWGYALLDAWKARGEVSCLMDFRVTAQGVLTVNGSLQAGPGQPPTYFATAFYTQGIGSRFSTWVEAFAYGPGPTLGIGSGWQYLLGKERLAALDLALNYRTGGAFQTQIGLSKKGRLLRRPLFRS